MKCPQCHKEMTETVKKNIWVNGEKVEMEFCSLTCATHYQMGCEG